MKSNQISYTFDGHSDQLDAFLADKSDGVFYVGHASILVRLNGKMYLFDAVCQRPPYLESWVFYPPQVMDARLLNVDAVFVSHIHQDHFDTEFLRQLPSTTPIYVVGGRPDFANALKDAGIKTTEIPPNQLTSLGNGVEVYAILHEYNTIDSSVVIKNQNFSVYHGNDNFVSAGALKPMVETVGKIDVGCVPFSFIHWYPFLLEDVDPAWKDAEATRLIEKYLDLGIEQAEALKASVVIPFGANLVYHDSAYSVMNRAVLSPIDFVDYARNKLGPVEGKRYQPMFADDMVLKSPSGHLEVRCQERSKDQFLEYLESYLQERKKDFDTPRIHAEAAKDLSWLQNKIQARVEEPIDHIVRVESSGEDNTHSCKIEVNMRTREVKLASDWTPAIPYHHFVVEPLAMNAWLERKISFEEVIGTRRFRIRRVPNDYNLKVLEFLNNVL